METVFSTIVAKNVIVLTLSQNVAGVVNICKFLLSNIFPFSAQIILLKNIYILNTSSPRYVKNDLDLSYITSRIMGM